jgi:hypothetical protein
MKDSARQHFLFAPHVSGTAGVKPKDYDAAEEVEAENEYAAWLLSRAWEKPLMVGDLLETASGQLRICKYVGFEEARWIVMEKPVAEKSAPETLNAVPSAPVPVPEAAQA